MEDLKKELEAIKAEIKLLSDVCLDILDHMEGTQSEDLDQREDWSEADMESSDLEEDGEEKVCPETPQLGKLKRLRGN
jgi:predicted  nucleic acid-binding Zn-ribbon protein